MVPLRLESTSSRAYSLGLVMLAALLCALALAALPGPAVHALSPTAVPPAGLYIADSQANPGHVYRLNSDATLTSYYTRSVVGGPAPLTHFAFAPDGTLYFVTGLDNNIYNLDANNNQQLYLQFNDSVRDLAFDAQGVLYFSITNIDGGVIYSHTATTSAPFYTVNKVLSDGAWNGDFALDAGGNLFLSNGSPAAAHHIYQVAGNTPAAIYTATTAIGGFARDAGGAFYYSDLSGGIYRVVLGQAPVLVWAIPGQAGVSDLNIVGSAGPLPVHFQGRVDYTPAPGLSAGAAPTGTGQPNVPLSVLAYNAPGGPPILLTAGLSGPDGQYDLGALMQGNFDHFQIVKGFFRGTAPLSATSSLGGSIVDPTTVNLPGSSNGAVCCVNFYLHDPVAFLPRGVRGRFLIVTSAALAPHLGDFVTFKQYQGFDVVLKTVEELGGLTRNQRSNAVRSYEKSLLAGAGGLRYVLLVGSDSTIPFVRLSPFGPDPIRDPTKYKDGCGMVVTEANQCGWPTDWYYVDLNSNWDSNGDGVIGEAFWPDPKNPPAIQDNQPAFHPDVFLGRIDLDGTWSVPEGLSNIMAFERDSGLWKQNTLLSGAMMDYAGQGWDPADAITGTYKAMSGPTDDGNLMEYAWNHVLSPEGYNRVRLYEKEHPPTGYAPSGYAVDLPLSEANLMSEWQSQDIGLVKVAGHGNNWGVYRKTWTSDADGDGIVQDPTKPTLQGGVYKSGSELGWDEYLSGGDAYKAITPGHKPVVLMVMGCDTGDAGNTTNLPNILMSADRIAAWTGGSATVGYGINWSKPSNGWGQTMDYNITDAIFRRHLPMGDAVWTGLNDYWTAFHAHDWGFISWDLYGDPSMEYWGEGTDGRAPWPMFHYDLPGLGETALQGPYSPTLGWNAAIPSVPSGTLTSSPVVAADGSSVLGDANGTVHAYNPDGSTKWTRVTGGAIVNAAVIAADGTVFVKSQDGFLYALDAKTGAVHWSRSEGASEASPKMSGDGSIYVGGQDSNGFFLDAFQPNGVRNARAYVDARITTAPSLDRFGSVYVGTANGTVYQFKFDLSSPISRTLTPGFAIGSGLAVTSDNYPTVIAPSANKQVVAYQPAFDSILWTFALSDAVHSAPALSADGRVFFGTAGGAVYAVQASDGSLLWSVNTGSAVDSAPAVDSTSVYVVGGSPATLYALRRADGGQRWTIALGGTSSGGSSPAIGYSDTIYVATSNGKLQTVVPYLFLLPPFLLLDPLLGEIVIHINPGDPDPTTQVQIERRTEDGAWQVLGQFSHSTTSFADGSVVAGVHYAYRALTLSAGGPVRPADASQPSDYSPPVSTRAPDLVPSAPSAPAVSALSVTQLQLTWSAPPSNTLALAILRQGPADSGLLTVTLADAGATSLVDEDLLPSTTYTYALRAIGQSGLSPLSPTGSGTTLAQTLPAPRDVGATPLNNTTFRVCWTPAQPGLDAVIARLADGVFRPQVLASVPAGQSCYTDVGAYAGGFVYWVKHRQGPNESDWARSSRTQAPDFAPTVIRELYLPNILR